MKVLFCGTPEFADVTLSALTNSSHTVVGVVTQPDRAMKRGKTQSCPVKITAQNSGIDVFQPEKIGDIIGELPKADVCVTAAFGQILPQKFLDNFPLGVINVHASLLPKYRGASPITAAIANGDKQTGVTIMKTVYELDAGDILSVAKIDIALSDNLGTLTEKLANVGAKLLIDALDNFDKIKPKKQVGKPSFCRTIKKQDQIIDFNLSASQVVNMIRSISPVPCAKTTINGEQYKIYNAAVSDIISKTPPGTVVCAKNRLTIACNDGSIDVLEIQAPSKNVLNICDFLRGKTIQEGTCCGQ